MKKAARILISRGSVSGSGCINLHGALTDVFEYGSSDTLTEDNSNFQGIAACWRAYPFPAAIQLEEGQYTLTDSGGDQTDLQAELQGWTYPIKSNPYPPRFPRELRRAWRRWIPDETCTPFFLSAARIGVNASNNPRPMLEFRVPHGMEMISEAHTYGDSVAFDKTNLAAWFTVDDLGVLNYTQPSPNRYPVPNGLTEVQELNGAGNPSPGFTPTLGPQAYPRAIRLKAGFYKFIRENNGQIGMNTMISGWTYRPKKD